MLCTPLCSMYVDMFKRMYKQRNIQEDIEKGCRFNIGYLVDKGERREKRKLVWSMGSYRICFKHFFV